MREREGGGGGRGTNKGSPDKRSPDNSSPDKRPPDKSSHVNGKAEKGLP